MKHKNTHSYFLLALLLAAGFGAPTHADESEWQLIRPSSTGIPGEAVHFARFDPQGDMWVAARWPFWGEGGFGIYNFDAQTWTTYANVNSEFPSQWANDIEFAADGVVWMATDNGLVKKDGESWTIYNTSNAPLLHNVISNIELDSKGHVWINNTTNTYGAIFEFDGENWTSFSVPDDLQWDYPWTGLSGLFVDSNDHVWCGNATLTGVAEYDGKSWVIHGQSVDYFNSFAQDQSGNIWMEGSNAFHKFDGNDFSTYYYANTPFVNTTVTSVAVGSDGAVYAGNWSGQVIKSTNAGASWSLFTWQNASIYSIAPAPESEDVWVTTPGAARHLDGFGNWLEAFNTYNTGMPDYFIKDIMHDSAGNTWCVSSEAGVSSFDGTQWFNLGSHNPNQPWPPMADGADCIFEDSDGNIWFGSNGIARWDGENIFLWDWQNSNLGVETFVAITQDGSGTIWAGSKYNGMVWFDGFDWQRHLFAPPGWAANWVRDIDVDLAGNIWVTTFAVHMFDGQTWSDFPQLNDMLFDMGGANVIIDGPDGTIWIGTNEGLVAFDGKNWIVYDINNSPLPAAEVHSIAFRDDGLMAVSTMEFGPNTPFPNGVAVIDGDIDNPANWTIHTYENSPLPHYQLSVVEFDAAGNLWISATSEAVAVLLIGENGVLGDLDGDGVVSTNDLLILFSNWGSCPVKGQCPADLDDDGQVGTSDLLILFVNWG